MAPSSIIYILLRQQELDPFLLPLFNYGNPYNDHEPGKKARSIGKITKLIFTWQMAG
ncbi:hypothetical protein J7E78_11360 [Paenibacillus polymyxa]|uniref:hypothetical protein n=1 Tax=Paenibacillus polymyxa TaxID=1406 RepID=UPI001BE9F091|nr:hypothetical protein [Paenibacillus polymyxa]MBT2284135.1 hypothetical protein [Paenibacillus polymyxa]